MTRASEIEAFLERMPFARTMGLTCNVHGNLLTTVLPFQQKLVGNTSLPALHGGAIGAFLELTAMAQLFLMSEVTAIPKPIDLTVDYLRSGRAKDLFGRAELRKVGSRMASVQAEAWQDDRDKPIATLRAQFLVERAPVD